MPWAGTSLLEDGGIYVIGIATDGGYYQHEAQTYDACYERASDMCCGIRHERSHTPFWRYVDALSTRLLGKPYYETTEHWGWSNLLKIGGAAGSPRQWPSVLIDGQRKNATKALCEEFARLKKSLIAILSDNDWFILKDAVGSVRWDISNENSGYWSWSDERTGNLFIWGYHPAAATRGSFWDGQLDGTVKLARRSFAWAEAGIG